MHVRKIPNADIGARSLGRRKFAESGRRAVADRVARSCSSVIALWKFESHAPNRTGQKDVLEGRRHQKCAGKIRDNGLMTISAPACLVIRMETSLGAAPISSLYSFASTPRTAPARVELRACGRSMQGAAPRRSHPTRRLQPCPSPHPGFRPPCAAPALPPP